MAPSQARQWVLVTVVTETHPTFAWPSTPTTTSPFNETEGEKDGGKSRAQQSDHRERGGGVQMERTSSKHHRAAKATI